MAVDFFTICARNYLAFAAVLGESVLKQHPGSRFTVWLLDEGDYPALPDGIGCRPLSQAISDSEKAELTLRYHILELATAVKPVCMMRHFAEGAERVVYLDPDICVFRPLDEVFEALDSGAQGVLTPHLMAPLPQDGAHPDDLDIQRSGIYNLGFLALASGRETDELLAWWWGWLKTHCFADPSTGVFTDQKWMNFSALFWPRLLVLRHSGYNVAYWNLPQRSLAKADNDWQVDGEPLVFFHFSGFDPVNPGQLSKHQDRIDVRPWSDLAKLLAFYADAVMRRGHGQTCRLKLPALTFDNGIPFDNVCRRLYLDCQGRFANPLATGPGTFFAWINEPVFDGSPKLSRYLKAIYDLRVDVQKAFPDLSGRDRADFLSWVRSSAIQEMQVPRDLLEAAGLFDTPAETALGVNYAGYLRAEMGVGEAARGYIRALRARDFQLGYADLSDLAPHRKEDQSLGDLTAPADNPTLHDINIIHVNADQLPVAREFLGPGFFRDRYNIGIWAWETQSFPESWFGRFRLVDEVWVGSSFMAEAIGRVAPVPVIVMPHVVETPAVAADRKAFGLDEAEFVFLFMFDFRSIPSRKNPEAAIRAFSQAFTPDDPVRLLIKSMNGEHEPEAMRALKHLAGDHRVDFLDRTLDNEERYRLIASCDAFLSLHRAEGFGLAIAEAMSLGKPVIATGWSGNMDFMTVANSFPVAYHLKPLEQDHPPYPAGTLWAEADIDHASRVMRLVYSEPELAARIGARAREDIQKYFGTAAVGERMAERLGLIAARATQAITPFHDQLPAMPRWRRRLRLVAGKAWRIGLNFVPARYHAAAHRLLRRIRAGWRH